MHICELSHKLKASAVIQVGLISKYTEVTEAMPMMDTSDQFTDRNNTMTTKNPGITGEQHNFTTPPTNTFRTVNIEDQWLKRYIQDGKNSQICDMVEKVEVTTKDGNEWYKVKIPYLSRFYNTDMFLVGKHNNCIYAVRGEETAVVHANIMDTIQPQPTIRITERGPLSQMERHNKIRRRRKLDGQIGK